MENLLPYHNSEQMFKVTSEKVCALLCSAWNLALYCKILNENMQRWGVTISWSPNNKITI